MLLLDYRATLEQQPLNNLVFSAFTRRTVKLQEIEDSWPVVVVDMRQCWSTVHKCPGAQL